jgi:endoglucanase
VIAELAMALTLYAPPGPATHQARVYEQQGRTRDARLMRKMARVPQGVWITGPAPRRAVARTMKRAAGKVPVLVAYDLPRRRCRTQGYQRWIDGFAKGIGAQRAIVILEPDALPSGCGARALGPAVKRLERVKRASVYVDAGHSRWQPAAEMARRLQSVRAPGFSLNVSNFRATGEVADYGADVSRRLGGAHFVIDTSRNGRGPYKTEWCNPPGRALGTRPTTATGHPLIDAYLWIKVPGESDGQCSRGLGPTGTVDPEWGILDPPAGAWFPQQALQLARLASPPLP